MPRRRFRRQFGETSLERKCRWLFGVCLLPLIVGSFWWYGQKTDQLVYERNEILGRELVTRALLEEHSKISTASVEGSSDVLPVAEGTDDSLDPRQGNSFFQDLYDQLAGTFEWRPILPRNSEGEWRPQSHREIVLLNEWTDIGQTLMSDEDIEARQIVGEGRSHDDGIYHYYQAVFAKQSCLLCHGVFRPELELKCGDLMAIIHVEVDESKTTASRDENKAWLLVAAITTVFLAMVLLFIITKLIIVWPLKHLRDVSNAVREGDVDQRAAINTGDEFEELGAAFNRMLRQLLSQHDQLRDVNTELDAKVDQLAQANMRLFEMNRLKSDFLATVSHELRTPLNSIIGFSDVLRTIETLDERQKRYVNNIQRSGKMLLEMINDILDLAKIESGKMDVRLTEFRIDSLIAGQCDLARPLSERKNIDLDTQIEPNLPPLYQDQAKLQQILNNLLSNAIKFTPEGGRIVVTAQRDTHGQLRLVVRDNGVGISEEEQTLVFEKFRQGKTVLPSGDAMTREYSGTGLGLSIVKELSRLLEGEVSLESELGKGSTFTVRLPWRCRRSREFDSQLADDLRDLTAPQRLELAAHAAPAPPSGPATPSSP